MELVINPIPGLYSGRLLIYWTVFLLLISCTNTTIQHDQRQSRPEERREALTKPPSGFSDSLQIRGPAAVFFNPGIMQLTKIKEITDSSIFKSMLHDCYFQQRNARAVISKYYPNIHIIEPLNTRYLVYTPKEGKRECIDLDKKNDPCGIILFDGVKPSRFTDMTNIDTDLGIYFRR